MKIKFKNKDYDVLMYTKHRPDPNPKKPVVHLIEFDDLQEMYRFLVENRPDPISFEEMKEVFDEFGHWGFCCVPECYVAFIVRDDEMYQFNKISVIAHELDHLARPARNKEESEKSAAKTASIAAWSFWMSVKSNAEMRARYGENIRSRLGDE